MKMYDYKDALTPEMKSQSETAIDPAFKESGLANGTLTERDATHDEELAECYRLRVAAYPSLNDQADAQHKARMGNAAPLAELDAAIAQVKTTYPKPTAPIDPVANVQDTGSSST